MISNLTLDLLSHLPKVEKPANGEPGHHFCNVKTIDLGRSVFGWQQEEGWFFGFITDKRTSQKKVDIDAGEKNVLTYRKNVFDEPRVNLIVNIWSRILTLQRNHSALRDDIQLIFKEETKSDLKTVPELQNFVYAGSEQNRVIFDRLALLTLKAEPVNKSLDEAILLGIVLTENDQLASKQKWLSEIYHHDSFLGPVTSWANLLNQNWDTNKFGIYASFSELKKAYVSRFGIFKSHKVDGAMYLNTFIWYNRTTRHKVVSVKLTADYGNVYMVRKGNSTRDFLCFVPEAYLIDVQEVVRGPKFREGEFLCLPDPTSRKVRYESVRYRQYRDRR